MRADSALQRPALSSRFEKASRGSNHRRTGRHVVNHERIRSNARVVPNDDISKQLCSSADVDMPPDARSAIGAVSQCDLLEDQAIHADFAIGKHDDTVRVR